MIKTAQNGIILLPILLVTIVIIGAVLLFKSNLIQPQTYQQTQNPSPITNNADLLDYTSKDLKISFKYPKDWYVDEKDYNIIITSFKTKIGEGKAPSEGQIKIVVDNYSGCFPTLEEDLINPACGQGKVKNKIFSKETKQTSGGEFLKYTLDSYDENQRVQYFFQKGDKILDIEKHPDPSQFEKEFEQIVNAIKFL